MLSINKINVFYGKIQVLWDVSFEVRAGEIVSIIGSNGAGKTTTLKSIVGLIQPASGSVTLSGQNLNTTPAYQIVCGGIALVPEGRKLFPKMSVMENLEMGAYMPAARKKKSQNLDLVLDLFPVLRERRNQLAGTLSGGEQQMLAIGRALMSSPNLLMLDEPSLGLSPLLVDEIFQNVKSLNDQGITILLVEQNVAQALELAHRAYVLETGRIVAEGPAKELLESELVRTAYLGM